MVRQLELAGIHSLAEMRRIGVRAAMDRVRSALGVAIGDKRSEALRLALTACTAQALRRE